ncbi:predicted protein [Naegleria gruberi]|uniref:Predicted protein n=1 Tax=Naegleria gruberi TaxID=5762 RepID=D2V9H2_NAEGR|nr:uncharacterized protein NAEGRDRAFT_65440 [Naegleria gruberi]EFC46592.1 predicted protein [Naegleria gruberi]|eukprot:XP_002679336.1 predicted protein [Naegleria gruberi strain NEG-M]
MITSPAAAISNPEEITNHKIPNLLETNLENSQKFEDEQEFTVESVSSISDRLFKLTSCTKQIANDDEQDDFFASIVNSFEEEDADLLFGDECCVVKGVKYRIWDWNRSQLPNFLDYEAFVVRKGFRIMCVEVLPVEVSYCSEIVESSGKVYALFRCVEHYETCVKLAQKRTNIIPILCHSKLYEPSEYESLIMERIDTLYLGVHTSYTMEILQLISNRFFKEDISFALFFKIPDGCTNVASFARYCLGHEQVKRFYSTSLWLLEEYFGVIGKHRLTGDIPKNSGNTW